MLPRGAGPRRDGRSRALQRRFGALGRRGRAQRKPPPSGSPLRSTGAAQSESSCGRATQNASTPHAAIRSVSCQIRQPVVPHTSRHAGARLHSEPPCCFGRRWFFRFRRTQRSEQGKRKGKPQGCDSGMGGVKGSLASILAGRSLLSRRFPLGGSPCRQPIRGWSPSCFSPPHSCL